MNSEEWIIIHFPQLIKAALCCSQWCYIFNADTNGIINNKLILINYQIFVSVVCFKNISNHGTNWLAAFRVFTVLFKKFCKPIHKIRTWKFFKTEEKKIVLASEQAIKIHVVFILKGLLGGGLGKFQDNNFEEFVFFLFWI
jgi:hypothetical protein